VANLHYVPTSPRELAWDGFLEARMNAIYYQRVVTRLKWWDMGLRLASLLLASGGVVTAIKVLDSTPMTIGVGIVSAVLSATSLVLGLPDKARAAAAFIPQYVAHANRFRALFIQGDGVSASDVNAALEAMGNTAVAEAEKAPELSAEDREKAFAQVLQEIGAASPA